jgi:hypothetical protein
MYGSQFSSFDNDSSVFDRYVKRSVDAAVLAKDMEIANLSVQLAGEREKNKSNVVPEAQAVSLEGKQQGW